VSAEGVQDLIGNVREWTQTRFRDGEYSKNSVQGCLAAGMDWPKGGKDDGARVLRGASWINDDPDDVVASSRDDGEAGNRNRVVGFRVVCAGGSAGG